MKKEPNYDDYFICPKCKSLNKIQNKQYLGAFLCECKTICKNCNHEDNWAYGFYESTFNT